jgi:hypothetical protein
MGSEYAGGVRRELEGFDRGLLQGTLPTLAWRELQKPGDILVNMVCDLVKNFIDWLFD